MKTRKVWLLGRGSLFFFPAALAAMVSLLPLAASFQEAHAADGGPRSPDAKSPALNWLSRTGTFAIDSRKSGSSVAGVLNGTYAVSGRELKLHIDKGEIVAGRLRKQEHRQVASFTAAIASTRPELTDFIFVARSEPVLLNQEIDSEKSIAVDGTDVVIPLNRNVPADFAGCWLSITFTEANGGVHHSHAQADFAPGPPPSAEEQEPVAHFRFADKIDPIRGAAQAWDLQNVSFSPEGMFINGEYENGGGAKPFRAQLALGAVTPGQMTFGLHFKLNPERPSKCLLFGDRGSRWFGVTIHDDRLTLTFNNGRQFFPLHGIEMGPEKWNRLVVSIDARNHTATAFLNGVPAEPIKLPDGFVIDANQRRRMGATDVSFTDYGSGGTFSGWVSGLIVYNRALTGAELTQLATQTRDGWAQAPSK